jgi:hypothetical protein
MSLHKFAEQVAANGRGDDSLLVHMTPDEVRNLQKFAEANGTTLTINPTTGLPEAGLLSDLFKAVAPIALGAFLGPAGFGLSSMMAGVATGGITALATGSLSRGLMAGLGAYGGAGLGESLMTAGGGMSAANAATAAQGQLGATNLALGEALPAQAAEQFTQDAIARMTPSGAVSAGFNAATASPTAAMNFAKGNLGNLAYAAAPIMAGAMVPTTTQAPTGKNENYIRQFDFNINPDTGKPDPLYGLRTMAPVKANEWKDKTFQGQRDLFRQQNPNPYELGVGSLNQPPQQQQQTTPMATGGIVALAAGGDYRTLTKDSSADDIASAYKQFTTAGGGDTAANQQAAISYLTNLGIGQDKIGQAYGTYQASPTYTDYTQQNVTDYLTSNKDINIAEETARLNANPLLVNQAISQLGSGYLEPSQTATGSGAQNYFDAFTNRGIDANELYAANLALNPNYSFDAQTGDAGIAALNRAFNVAKQFDTYEYGKAGGTELQKDVDFLKQYDAGKFVGNREQQIEDIARETGLSLNEAARRYDAARASMAFKPPIVKPPILTDTIVGGTGNDVINNTFDSSTEVARKITNPYGNATNPGDLTYNTDGSTTVTPNIPYRPYGGFRGIQEIKDAYTRGGGSLGYTSRAPQNIAEFNQLYNKQTGDSLAAYDYLMGKGGGKYPSKSLASQMAVPYAEYALGKKTVGLKPITKTTGTGTTTFKEPQTYFDEKAYLAANPDVEAEMKAGKSNFASAYEHWLMYGKKEGRKFTGDYDSYLSAVEAEKAKTTRQTDAGGTGDGGTGGGPGGTGPGGVGGAGGPGSTTAADPADMGAPAASDSDGDAVGGYYSRGKLNYRAKDMAMGGATGYAIGGGLGSLGSYSDGGRLLKGPGDGVSDSIPATIGAKQQPARLADGEFVIPARIVSELGNGSTDAGAKKLYAMMDRVQRARGKTTGKNKVAANSRSDKYLPA